MRRSISYLHLSVGSILLGLIACGSAGTGDAPATPPPASTIQHYSGTASVGDFLTITLDPVAKTLAYANISNGDAGTVPFVANTDGTYTLNDPAGNLQEAYELPGYALVIKAAKTGPAHDTASLITAVQSQSITVSGLANKSYNYMQFRTSSGGMEIGSVLMDGSSNLAHEGYWPYGAMSGGTTFHGGALPASSFTLGASGQFLRLDEPGGGSDYIFGTSGGFLAVDMGNGSMVCLQKAAAKDFQVACAGTYKAIYFQKTGASTGMGNVESGVASLGKAVITISSSGQLTVTDGTTTLAQAQLAPVADCAYLQGAGKLGDPCHGLFTSRIITANSQRDVFVAFLDGSLIFSAFTCPQPSDGSSQYDYFYGVGLKAK